MVVGACLPQASAFTFLVRYSVMIMLFMSFLGVVPRWDLLRVSHLWLLIANVLVAVTGYLVVSLWSTEYALLAFLTGIMPTAAVAPVIAGLLSAPVGYVTLALLLSNVGMALAIPFLLPLLGIEGVGLTTAELVGPVMITVMMPMLLSQAIRVWLPSLKTWFLRGSELTFWLFISNVVIAMAKASDYLQHESNASLLELLWVALIVVAITTSNFGLGYFLEKKGFRQASSIALGRKNTMFGVWVAVTFLPASAALGPIAYVITHNLWHSLLIGRKNPDAA